MAVHDTLNDSLSGLSREDWIARLEDIAEDEGFFEPVGERHTTVFVDRSPSVLLVTFEEADKARLTNPAGQPIGFRLAAERGWSNLAILAHGETWFRDERLFKYFDRLIDDGLFEDFDKVVFYGAEMGGYAAAAYSVASPGATVVSIQPAASLAPSVAGWDIRFRDKRRLDFSSRFGFAPAMCEGSDQTFLIFDPYEWLDGMHAALFQGEHVCHLRTPHLGGRIEADLEHMGILHRILELAGEGTLSREAFFDLYRARRDHAPYLKRVLDHLEQTDRPFLSAVLCQNAVKRLQRRRFHDGLVRAREKLAERGILLEKKNMAPSV